MPRFSKDGEWSRTFALRANLRRAVAFDIMATAENAEPDAPNIAAEPKVHEMRISDHTQIKNAVRFALRWLQVVPVISHPPLHRTNRVSLSRTIQEVN